MHMSGLKIRPSVLKINMYQNYATAFAKMHLLTKCFKNKYAPELCNCFRKDPPAFNTSNKKLYAGMHVPYHSACMQTADNSILHMHTGSRVSVRKHAWRAVKQYYNKSAAAAAQASSSASSASPWAAARAARDLAFARHW